METAQKRHSFWDDLPKPIFALAPMEDVTDTAFRRLIASCGRPSVFFSEFTSTDGMFSAGEARVVHRLRYTEDERPLVAQIWGKNPERYFQAAQRLESDGFDGIDINMGCPVDKIVKSGNCSALIENRPLVKELVQAVREGAPSLPLSLKTRMGFRVKDTESWSEFLLELEPEVLTMHGRIAKHLSKYPADWEEIAKVVALRNQLGAKTLVLGNGDVSSYSDGLEKISATGVDGVMVGRGIFQNPYFFDPEATPLGERSTKEKLDLLAQHLDLFEETWGPHKPFRVLKKYFKIYLTQFAGASELRMSMVQCGSFEEARSTLDEFRRSLSNAA